MTAFEAYEEAIDEGKIPASIIIEDLNGTKGLATVALDVVGNSRAERLVFSHIDRDRAIAAIFACHTAEKCLEKYHEDLRIPVYREA